MRAIKWWRKGECALRGDCQERRGSLLEGGVRAFKWWREGGTARGAAARSWRDEGKQ